MFGDISSSPQSFSKGFEGFASGECKLAPQNGVMLRKLKFVKLSNKLSAFYGTEHEFLLLCSQEPAFCKFLEPDESIPQTCRICL